MNTARIVVLTIALAAGGLAAYLASGFGDKPPPAQAIALQTVDVLVAKSDIGLGQTVAAEDLQWQTWPAATASNTFIRRNDRPDAATQIAGSIARSPFIAGEPIREPKLVKGNGSGFMAAILPTGMRAISTEISPETGAGGFILPNDRVDVILTRREKHPENRAIPEDIGPELDRRRTRLNSGLSLHEAIPISEPGAGGFILPNDRVDVFITRREKNPENPAISEVIVSE